MFERGERQPRLNAVIKLAAALSVPLEELVAGIEWKPQKGRQGFEFWDQGDARAR
jgi:hypothetical protein